MAIMMCVEIMMGKGVMVNASKKFCAVTTSSAETKILSNEERFLKHTWFCYFRMTQGDVVKEDMLFQDNKSNVTIHKNYYFSIGKGTK